MSTPGQIPVMTEPTITTTAVGLASGPPDEVGLEFSANAVEPDVMRARRAVAEQATQLRQVLDATGVPEARVRTDQFRIRQRRPDRGEPVAPESLPYDATESITVTLHALDRLGEVLSAAVDEAGVEIESVTFAFRTRTQRTLQREAIADAVETARQKAEAAAAAESLALGDVRSMVTEAGSRPHRTAAGRPLAMDMDESGAVESGPIDVQVSVEVAYELQDS